MNIDQVDLSRMTASREDEVEEQDNTSFKSLCHDRDKIKDRRVLWEGDKQL